MARSLPGMCMGLRHSNPRKHVSDCQQSLIRQRAAVSELLVSSSGLDFSGLTSRKSGENNGL